jgi:hypothetical protein
MAVKQKITLDGDWLSGVSSSVMPEPIQLEEVDPLAKLRDLVAEHGTIKAAAASVGLNNVYAGDLLLQRRPFSDRALALLGLRRAVVAADPARIKRILKSNTRCRPV